MADKPALWDRMRDFADLSQDSPTNFELRRLATNLETAAIGFYGTPQTCDVKTFMGSWARARKFWCELTGESLV